MLKLNLLLDCTIKRKYISNIFRKIISPQIRKNVKICFADQVSETPGTPVLRLFLRLFWSISREKNHFKVNVRLRPSNWHINKNLQKIKSILYQDSCWINRAPWRNYLAVWKHLGCLILRLLLQILWMADLLVDKHLTNWSQPIFLFKHLSNWSQPVFLFANTWATDRWLFLQHL